MTKKMLIDATHSEETRVAVIDQNRLVDFDYESTVRKQLKGSIFLAKVTRVEPSLQAAFVNFGGNRHGFLPFSEIHPDYFRIPISDREAILAEQEAEMAAREAEEEEMDLEEADQDESAEDSDDQDEAEADDDVEVDEVDEEAAEVEAAEAEEENSDENKDKGDKGRGRGRRGGRGRGGKGRRSKRNRSVEHVGGDGVDGDHPVRPSLRRNYKIQEVVKRGQIMLIQVSKEERGNKGAAVTSYLSLPGRYCVLMPNSPRAGGVSRKIANFKDRKRMREILKELNVPEGMSVILRTAGVERSKTDIKRDLDYLLKLWNDIRELTLGSTAPALVHEEGYLTRRSIRDIYARDIEEVIVAGEDGYKNAKKIMKMMIPSHAKKVKEYADEKIPLFQRYQVENQIIEIGTPEVVLPSGGYLVINPTEALVSIDVNSGRATKERHIEETALNTNLEAAEEVARQLRLRDLGGLVVIDFIDMEDRRNNRKVEQRLKQALSSDRARIQIGRISTFGLLELSRQRLNPSLTEAQFIKCKHCEGIGYVRSVDSTAIVALRALEAAGVKGIKGDAVTLKTSNEVALYILNNKRDQLGDIEARYDFKVVIEVSDDIGSLGYAIFYDGQDQTQHKDIDSLREEKQRNSKRKGRRRGRRGGRGRKKNDQDDGDDSDNDQEIADTADENDKSDEKSEDDDKPKKSSSRGRGRGRKKGDVAEDKDNSDKEESKGGDEAVKSDKDDKPKKGGRKPSRTKKAAEKKDDSADKETAKDDSKDSKPKKTSKKSEKTSEDAADKDEKPAKKTAAAKSKSKAKSSSTKKAKADETDAGGEDTPAKAAEKKAASNDSEPKDYENVNEKPDKKKKGWWSR